MKLLDRLLFGREGVKRAEEADRRLEAAIARREHAPQDLEDARRSLMDAIDDIQKHTRGLESVHPPVVRFVVVTDDVDDNKSNPRESQP